MIPNLNPASSNITYFALVTYPIFICLGQILYIFPLKEVQFLAVLLYCWFYHFEFYLFQLLLSTVKIMAAAGAHSPVCPFILDIWPKPLVERDDSAEQPGNHFSSCSRKQEVIRVSMSVSQAKSFNEFLQLFHYPTCL